MGENKRFLYDDKIGYVELLNTMGTDKCIVDSARVSFNKDTPTEALLLKKDVKLINYLAKNKHTSPFEHCAMTFRIKVPLIVARHHMRHRTMSFNEVSRRYTSIGVDMYLPTAFRRQHQDNRQASVEGEEINPVLSRVGGTTQAYVSTAKDVVKSHARKSLKLYNQLISAGVCREQARLVLPQSMYTEYWCSANLLNIIKFLKLRLPEESQWEIRRLAEEMSLFVKDMFPEAYKACIQADFH
jgi:thymidylate synthase (FAD)